MRRYPHRPDEESLLDDKEFLVSLLKPAVAPVGAGAATTDEPIWALNAERARACASYAYAFEEPVETVRYYLERSNASFATGLERRSPFDLGALMQQVATAIVVDDAALSVRLCSLPRARYQVDGSTFIPAVQREFDVWVLLVLDRRDEALALLQPAEAALATEKLPRAAQDECGPMLALLRAVLTDDAAALDAALARRADAIAKIYRTPSARQETQALLDLRGLALAAVARRHGLSPATDSVYLPFDIAMK